MRQDLPGSLCRAALLLLAIVPALLGVIAAWLLLGLADVLVRVSNWVANRQPGNDVFRFILVLYRK